MSNSNRLQRHKKRLRAGAVAVLLLMTIGVVAVRDKLPGAIELYHAKGAAGVYYRIREKILGPIPNVAWARSSAKSLAFDEKKLKAFGTELQKSKTYALIVARKNKIVYEYYAPGSGPNVRLSTAAMSKTLTASMLLLVMLSDGKISLDDPLHLYIPAWRDDPVRRKITIRQIVTHSSGIEDVDFNAIQSGWKKEYFANPEKRFRYALETSPILFEPGSRYDYSGVGYYALAYALGVALRESDVRDFTQLLSDRVMLPLGIPRHAWSISYQTAYEVDGMPLTAIGSGGGYTARAIARIGQLLLNGGYWNGRQIFDRRWTDIMMHYGGSPTIRQKNSSSPATGVGTWLNCDGFWPSLPRDSVIGFGGRHQILLVVPSLELVVVRMGESMTDDFWRDAETVFFTPLLATMTDSSSDVGGGSCSG